MQPRTFLGGTGSTSPYPSSSAHTRSPSKPNPLPPAGGAKQYCEGIPHVRGWGVFFFFWETADPLSDVPEPPAWQNFSKSFARPVVLGRLTGGRPSPKKKKKNAPTSDMWDTFTILFCSSGWREGVGFGRRTPCQDHATQVGTSERSGRRCSSVQLGAPAQFVLFARAEGTVTTAAAEAWFFFTSCASQKWCYAPVKKTVFFRLQQVGARLARQCDQTYQLS